MKRLFTSSLFAITVLLVFCNLSTLSAQAPSSARWLQLISSEYDSLSKVYSVSIEWKAGLIDDQHPEANSYNIYRSMIGYNQEPEDYELIGSTTPDDYYNNAYHFADNLKIPGGYFYYVRGISNDSPGEISPVIQAVVPSSYCVNLNAEIIDFKSFPGAIAMPGKLYEYQAYAKHRSARVQGFVRYALVDGPDGMAIDSLKGTLVWMTPDNASGSYYVNIRATSTEDSRAESIQEWNIRIANSDEMNSTASTVSVLEKSETFNIIPCPASNEINFYYHGNGNNVQIEMISLNGQIIYSKNLIMSVGDNLITLPVNSIPKGAYLLRITNNQKLSVGKVIIKE